MATLVTVTIDAAQKRNARLELQNRLEGAISLLDAPLTIEEVNSTTLRVTLPDELPAEELRAVLRTLSNLVQRPESGVLSAIQVSPEETSGIQRRYST